MNADRAALAAGASGAVRAAGATGAAGARAARSEFLWLGDGPAHIHGHVARPVLVHLDRFDARTVLDLGCGNGWFTAALARCGFDMVGLDSSRSGINIARQAHPDVSFRHADALQPPEADLHNRFDAVLAVETLDHVVQPRLLLQHAAQMLRPGGLLIVTTPYHGYMKNLGLALSGRFDLRLQALQDNGRLKFFSRSTLTALVQECGFGDIGFEPLGRVSPLARSMLVTARRPAA